MKINSLMIAGGIAALFLLGKGAQKVYTQSRGLRNNNPGNLDFNPKNPWQGQTGSDGRFAIFKAPEYGIRAMTIDIAGDIFKDGKNTLTKLMREYAPENENDTANYIAFVAKRLGVTASTVLTKAHFPKLLDAIITMENGINPYPVATVAKGIALGLQKF